MLRQEARSDAGQHVCRAAEKNLRCRMCESFRVFSLTCVKSSFTTALSGIYKKNHLSKQRVRLGKEFSPPIFVAGASVLSSKNEMAVAI